MKTMSESRFFRSLLSAAQAFSQSRSKSFAYSQGALQHSKRAIFSLHRDKEARREIREAERDLKKLRSMWKRESKLRYEGSIRAAMEEYLEALMYYTFVTKGTIEITTPFEPEYDETIGALADVTGELVRLSVAAATQGDKARVDTVHAVVEHVVEELLRCNLTGYLRQKFDDAKRNLHRVEDIRFSVRTQ